MATNISTNVAKIRRPLLVTTLALFGFSTLLGVLFILIAPNDDQWKFLGTTTLLSFFSLFTMNNLLRLAGPPIVKALAIGAIISNIVWTALISMLIWGAWDIFSGESYDIYQIVLLTIGFSICTTLTGSFLFMHTVSKFHTTTKFGAIATAWFLYIYYIPSIIRLNDGAYLSQTWQIVSIAGVLFAFSTISTPIIARIKNVKTVTHEPATTLRVITPALRAQLEAELRPKIEAELREKITHDLQEKIHSSKQT